MSIGGRILPDDMNTKIKTRQELAGITARLRAEGKVVGFTSGVFDLLHPGHVAYLERARAACDVLVVAVNSDASVHLNKGADRPICTGEDRARVVAGLGSVDFVFLFDEHGNNENILSLKPHKYIKAGDYSLQRLKSAPIVQGYGGEVLFIPMEHGYSTTGTIERILTLYSAFGTVCETLPPRKKSKAVLLDRDGTINEHVEYLHRPEQFRFLPGALAGLKLLQDRGYRLVIITNQPGIGLGYFTLEDFFRVNKTLLKGVNGAGINIDKIYFCPHSQSDGCGCRKPAPGLVERAVRELNIDLEQSWVIGDMTSDVQLAKRAGCRSMLVGTGQGGRDEKYAVEPDCRASDLEEAAVLIIAAAEADPANKPSLPAENN
jgi:D-glycero-D-manno-heptose 1,7-bisphosphate phosphatase